MQPLARSLARAVTLACTFSLSPIVAHAAPVTLQYSVVIDGICYSSPLTCPPGPFTGYTLTLTYDDQMTADVSNPPAGFHEAWFGTPTMTMTGGSITALANPFGTITDELSHSYMRRTEYPDTGFGAYGSTEVTARFGPTHQAKVPAGDGSFNAEYWDERITLNRVVLYTDVDGITTLPTPADMLAELSTGTFQLFWSTSVNTQSQCPESWDLSCRGPFLIQPGTFFAWGTATALGPVPSTVPEPASLFLVGLGLMAGGARLRRRLPRRLAVALVLAGGLALAPRAADAAPVTVQYSVSINRICTLATANCETGTFDGYTLTLHFDDVLLSSSGFIDDSTRSLHEAQFGETTMAMSGGALTPLANPWGTQDVNGSLTYLRRQEDRGADLGHGRTEVGAIYMPTHNRWIEPGDAGDGLWHYELWTNRIEIYRDANDSTSDGQTTMPTAADLLSEMTTGSFQITWRTDVRTLACRLMSISTCRDAFVIDPGGFAASGTATPLLLEPPPPVSTVPEPATLLLVGLGMVAGGARLRRRRPLSR